MHCCWCCAHPPTRPPTRAFFVHTHWHTHLLFSLPSSLPFSLPSCCCFRCCCCCSAARCSTMSANSVGSRPEAYEGSDGTRTAATPNVSVIVPGEDGGLAQFASMHSLIDAPTGFSFANDGTYFCTGMTAQDRYRRFCSCVVLRGTFYRGTCSSCALDVVD